MITLLDGPLGAASEIHAAPHWRGIELLSDLHLGEQAPATAHALAEDAQKSLDAGCDAHLCKPVRKKELIAAVLRFCAPPAATPSSHPPLELPNEQ